MKINDISLPYPVLGNKDDVFPLLKQDCIDIPDPKMTATTLIFNIRLKQRNKEIAQFVRRGDAEYVCEVNCPRTFYRKCYRQSKPEFEIEIPRKSVAGRIDFDTFITVKNRIENYHNKQFNPDYEDATFDMEPGYYLAVFPSAYYILNLKYDKLYAAGAFMQFANGGDDSRPTWFDLKSDKILIMLPPKMFRFYDDRMKADAEYSSVIIGSFVFNALIYALLHINSSEYEDKQWAETIKYRMETEPALKGYCLEDTEKVYELARTLLEDPYRKMFEDYNKLRNKQMKEE